MENLFELVVYQRKPTLLLNQQNAILENSYQNFKIFYLALL